MLGEEPIHHIKIASVLQNKRLVLTLIKQKKIFLILHYNGDNSFLLVNRKDVYKFKANNKNANFPTEFSNIFP